MVKTVRIQPSGAGEATPARAKAEALVGTLVSGRYRFETVLSCSETGAIYRAEHRAMRLRVVVKILYPEASPDEVARFEREAIAGAHVRHPNVAAATDSGKLDDGSLYIVLEHVAGATLRDVIDKGRLPLARAHKITRDLAAALAAVHEEGIVHRDVEPRNVMLGGPRGEDPKLVDFGLASIDLARMPGEPAKERPGKALTAVGLVIGAGPYSPPEAALGTTFLDARSDLYSLGVVAYEMFTGARPFPAEEPAALFAAQRSGSPPPFGSELGVPAAIEAIVRKLLERDASVRFQTAREVVEALEAAPPVAPSRPPSMAPGDFVPRGPSSAGPPPPASPWHEIRDAALEFFTRVGRAAGQAAEEAVRSAGPIAKQQRRVPTWAIVALASGVPLAFTIAWLLFRPAAGSTHPTSNAAAQEQRADALPASSAEGDVAPPPSAPGIIVVAPAPASAPAPVDTAATGDAAALRDKLRDYVKGKDWARAATAMQGLATADPAAFRDPNVVGWAVSTAVAVETTGGEDADKVFTTLSQRMGTDGLDLLFEIVRGRGGTKGSKRAADLLRNPEIAVMEPPALRAVFELHDAPCDKKPSLYERTVKDGDRRALTELRAMRAAECDRRRKHEDPCCFAHEPLDQAIQALRDRLGK